MGERAKANEGWWARWCWRDVSLRVLGACMQRAARPPGPHGFDAAVLTGLPQARRPALGRSLWAIDREVPLPILRTYYSYKGTSVVYATFCGTCMWNCRLTYAAVPRHNHHESKMQKKKKKRSCIVHVSLPSILSFWECLPAEQFSWNGALLILGLV
jgi:hypothetical protein